MMPTCWITQQTHANGITSTTIYKLSYSVSKHQRELNDMADWQSERRARDERLDEGSKFAEGKMVAPDNTTALLEAVIRPGDRICLEGDNQKQADFLAACLAKANPKVLHDLHVVQSGIVLAEHIDLFEKGIARRLDYWRGP
jgi:malonate decarboxylase alpha subunit